MEREGRGGEGGREGGKGGEGEGREGREGKEGRGYDTWNIRMYSGFHLLWNYPCCVWNYIVRRKDRPYQ